MRKTPIASRSSGGAGSPGALRCTIWPRSLDGPLPAPGPPAGFVVRGLAGEDDAAERAAHQPELTTERYRAFMQAPGYDQDLDLVAVAPEARFGAYCICWMDPANGVGEFEPVGTRPELRRRGLARAVVLDGFRRMKARGAHTALVRFEGENVPARRSYGLVGCDVRSTTSSWPGAGSARGRREEGRARVGWWAAMVPLRNKSVSVRLEEEAYLRLRRHSLRSGVPTSALVRALVHRWLQEQGDEEGEAVAERGGPERRRQPGLFGEGGAP